MDTELDVFSIVKGLRDLFKYGFLKNCELDDEQVTEQESKTLEELDWFEILENFKELLENLIKFKKNYKSSDKAELAIRSEKLEEMLQKREVEVRNHIRVQHQLKLHLEDHQIRIEELESKDRNNAKETHEKNSAKKSSKNLEADRIRKETDEKIKSLIEISDKKERIIHKLESENLRLKILLEEKTKDYENAKKELARLVRSTPRDKELQSSSSIDYLKKKLENTKTLTVLKLKSPIYDKQKIKSQRKSLGEIEIAQLTNAYDKKNVGDKKEETKALAKPKSRGHVRSSSDQKLLV
jgi:hypothetical protein